MRKSARLYLIAVVLAVCGLLSSSAQTANAIFNVSNFVGNAVNVSRLTIMPFLPGPAYRGSFLSSYLPPYTRANTPSLTNGTVTVSNLIMDFAYTVIISDGYSTIPAQIFPDSRLIGTNATINAANYVSKNVNPNGPYAIPYLPSFSCAIVSNITYQVGGSPTNISNASGTNVNLSGKFTAQKLSSDAGSITSDGYGDMLIAGQIEADGGLNVGQNVYPTGIPISLSENGTIIAQGDVTAKGFVCGGDGFSMAGMNGGVFQFNSGTVNWLEFVGILGDIDYATGGLNQVPTGNGDGTWNWKDLPAPNSVSGVITNAGIVWYAVKTNGVPAFAAPSGSICTTTNGQFFVRSNSVWLLK